MYLQRLHADDVYSLVSDSFCVVDKSLRGWHYFWHFRFRVGSKLNYAVSIDVIKQTLLKESSIWLSYI